jgi:glutaminyl-peptide cyclotransferase
MLVKNRRTLALLLGGLAACLAPMGLRYWESERLAVAAEGFDGERAFEDLRRFVALGPRPPGSAALDEERKYVVDELSKAGATVSHDSFVAVTPVGQVPMQNIIGSFTGDRPEVIVIAGHYDTARLPGIQFVGANDGGSSAAELLELGRVLGGRQRRLTYWLVFFDGEEAIEQWSASDSLYGSRHFVESMHDAGRLRDLRAVLLLDMVADRSPQFGPEGNSAPWLRDLVFSTARWLGYGDAFPPRVPVPVEDDHLPFLAAGVPAVDVIDFAPFLRGYHHTAQDTLERCSPDTLRMVGRVVLATLGELEQRLGR